MKLSFVIPCYRSETTIEIVVNEIEKEVAKRSEYDYEIILVSDHSPDDVWSVIKRIAQNNPRVKGAQLSRNFGQHAALLAGYGMCSGDYVISLDDDGQTPLESLYNLVDKLDEGYDAVYAYYNEIKQTGFRKFGTWMAKKMSEVLIGCPRDFKGSSFYIARAYVIREICKYPNSYPYLFGLVLRTTKNITCIPTEHRERLVGKSGYSFKSLLSLWLNGFTAFSVKPLELGTYAGFLMAFAGIVYAIVTVVRKLCGAIIAVGWTSTIIILLIIGGMILIMLGLIGEYVGRIYISINNAPQYIIKETTEEIEGR